MCVSFKHICHSANLPLAVHRIIFQVLEFVPMIAHVPLYIVVVVVVVVYSARDQKRNKAFICNESMQCLIFKTLCI